ncbi:MAG: glyoxalase [Anaerolineae bacterium]|nr:glyoxalase [Anaerolineae bacterium]
MAEILGLHHITLVSADAQRTADFYTRVLGQRMIKKTVNFDDPGSYHLYFTDETGTPGTAITFFEWPDAPKGMTGIGGTHHLALRVRDDNGLLKWKRRLTDLGIKVDGPYDRHYFKSIYFKDPDGVILEIATDGPGFLIDEDAATLGTSHLPPPAQMMIANRDEARIQAQTWPEPVPHITADMALLHGMHHITAISGSIQRTADFFEGVLGMKRVKMTDNFDVPGAAHWYWGVEGGRPGSILTYFGYAPEMGVRSVQMGVGQTHHYALAVADEDTQLEWREKLVQAGLRVSPVMDRIYFKSIYSSDPDGHIVEIATQGPGFAVDEAVAHLGEKLMLPPWLEGYRERIESSLKPIRVPQVASLQVEG